VALVSHKVVCKVLILSVLGLDNSHFWQVEQDVCATNLFEVRDGFLAAARLNDTCHLGDAASRVVRP
jgi:probable phosphoglycerate mutase